MEKQDVMRKNDGVRIERGFILHESLEEMDLWGGSAGS